MKIKFSHNKILFIIIAVLVIYLLFFNNTSGYSSNDAYDEGYDDRIKNMSKKTNIDFNVVHPDKSGVLYAQYVMGWNSANNDSNYIIVNRTATATLTKQRVYEASARIKEANTRIAYNNSPEGKAAAAKIAAAEAEAARVYAAKVAAAQAEAARVAALKSKTNNSFSYLYK